MSHTRTILFEGLGMSVEDFRCRAAVEPLGGEEPNPTHSIVFVRRGVFCRTRRHDTVVADPNHVLFYNASELYRYAHPVRGGDDCTILALDTTRALELVARYVPDAVERPAAPFRFGHGLSSKRAAWLHWELLGALRKAPPRIAVEDLVSELADEAVRVACRSHPSRRSGEPASAAAPRRQREIVEAATLALSRRLETPPSLTELAAALDCSPFHLSRTFHRLTGLSLRAYIRRLRTRAAAERLAAGARDLTRVALDFGYADHSHFTNSFRQEWHVPPSRFRDSLTSYDEEGPTRRPAGSRN